MRKAKINSQSHTNDKDFLLARIQVIAATEDDNHAIDSTLQQKGIEHTTRSWRNHFQHMVHYTVVPFSPYDIKQKEKALSVLRPHFTAEATALLERDTARLKNILEERAPAQL